MNRFDSTQANDVGHLANLLMKRQIGFSHVAAADAINASSRTKALIEKAAVGALHSGDGAGGAVLGSWDVATEAFFTSLRTTSVFFRLLDSGMRRVPFLTELAVTTANATAWIVGEGAPISLSSLGLQKQGLLPYKAAALMVTSVELVESADPGAVALINTELAGAISKVADQRFWQTIMPSPTASASSTGSDEAAARADVKALLDVVNLSGAGRLVFAMSPDVASALSLLPYLGRDMTPTGGELAGCPALVSDAIPAGVLRLVDARQIAGNAANLSIDASRQATIEMKNSSLTQSAATGTGVASVSMFQTSGIALRATLEMVAKRISDSAVAECTGIDATWAA